MAVDVKNIETKEIWTYSGISASQAVVCAYEQGTRKNYNTWDYMPPEKHPLFRREGSIVKCGDWQAIEVSE